MSVELGQNIRIETPTGTLSGRVVGTETRDPSRHGSGTPIPFVCIAVAAPVNEWLWVPVSEVTA